jgi:hypothetical protein
MATPPEKSPELASVIAGEKTRQQIRIETARILFMKPPFIIRTLIKIRRQLQLIR